jgi:hypothetical protein
MGEKISKSTWAREKDRGKLENVKFPLECATEFYG